MTDSLKIVSRMPTVGQRRCVRPTLGRTLESMTFKEAQQVFKGGGAGARTVPAPKLLSPGLSASTDQT